MLIIICFSVLKKSKILITILGFLSTLKRTEISILVALFLKMALYLLKGTAPSLQSLLIKCDVILWYHISMNSKQRKTLEKIMTTPAPANIKFDDVVKCMIAKGYGFKQGEGSRVAFIIGSEVLPIHTPHPNKELKKYAVRQLQLFIKQTEDLL